MFASHSISPVQDPHQYHVVGNLPPDAIVNGYPASAHHRLGDVGPASYDADTALNHAAKTGNIGYADDLQGLPG